MNLKSFFYGCLIGGAIIAVLIWKTCSHTVEQKPPEKPANVPTAGKIESDSVGLSKLVDSISKVADFYRSEADKSKLDFSKLKKDYSDLSDDYGKVLSMLPQDNPLAAELKSKYEGLQVASNKKDKACQDAIISLDGQVSAQKSLINTQDSAIAALRSSLRSCVGYSDELKKYADGLKARGKGYVGFSMIGTNKNWIAGAGVNAGFISKKGNIFEAGAFTLNQTIYGQISLKKIITFKKK